MRKPDFCICGNKGADQLRSNCAADQRLCFRGIYCGSPLLPKSEVLVIPRMRWLHPNMTEKLFTWTYQIINLKFQASSYRYLIWLYGPVCVTKTCLLVLQFICHVFCPPGMLQGIREILAGLFSFKTLNSAKYKLKLF